MSVFEFQLSSAAFLLMQRNALRALRICRATPVNVGGVDLVLDRIEFGGNAIRHDVDTEYTHDYVYFSEIRPFADKGFRTQIIQDVTVHVATWQAVLAAPNQTPPTTAFSLRLHFNLDRFSRWEDDCILLTQLERVEPLGLPPLPPGFGLAVDQVMAFVATQIRTSMPAKAVPIDPGSALPSGMHISNAGLGVDEAGGFVAFRLQLSPPRQHRDVVRLVGHVGLVERRVRRDRVVGRVQLGAVEVLVSLGRHSRAVRCHRIHDQQERLGGQIRVEEIQRLPPQHVGQVVGVWVRRVRPRRCRPHYRAISSTVWNSQPAMYSS